MAPLATNNVLPSIVASVEIIGGVAVVVLLGLLPGYLARQHNHPKAATVRALGLVGILIPFCWIAAIIWAFIGGTDAPPGKRPAGKMPAFVPRPAGYTQAESLDYRPGGADIDAEIERHSATETTYDQKRRATAAPARTAAVELFIVRGTHAGKPVTCRVKATDAGTAWRIAEQKGVAVQTVGKG